MSRATLQKDPKDVAAMFDETAAKYDLMNDVMSLGQTRLWRRAVLRAIDPQPGDRILDIAAGPGSSSIPLRRAGAQVASADFSLGMLRQGLKQSPELHFTAADATRLPFADESFDVVTMSFGFRNVVEPEVALREFLRVTRPGGRLLICEFSQPVNKVFRTVYSEYLMAAFPPVARRLSSNPDSYVYLAESIQSWPAQEPLARMVAGAGWADVEWNNLTGGVVALHRASKAS
ncbi:demethylmenaquinone methyltransferase [Janibacter limosus]|jgi:demethylmenaquinone methyltransferase/2-methoxy-6-polyprenyl-1,4-benzoquinol methylase|uniref:Demethylmenaquinone methyltransferase n=1 Tax=Janibacter limosus TaxID=53458 RepID=A0A4P6MTP8_9MICO|nr:demethylmenaquinone methyltransferase [Janibacter limosus]QBF47024.1 demethylmenaquinone methyltransferase [Janibacter limosus]